MTWIRSPIIKCDWQALLADGESQRCQAYCIKAQPQPREAMLGATEKKQRGLLFGAQSEEQSMPNLFEAQKHSTNNRSTIEASSICGCYYCQTIFSPHEIVAWTGLDFSKFNEPNAHANTALCPHCGSESVIGNKSGYTINIGFLSEMNDAWFEKTIVHKRTPRNLNP